MESFGGREEGSVWAKGEQEMGRIWAKRANREQGEKKLEYDGRNSIYFWYDRVGMKY